MDFRLIARTGLKSSRLVLGTMGFGNETDEAEASRMVARCRDLGINHFDTADVYQEGRSEEILGRLLAGCRDDVIVATKAYFPTSRDVNARGSSRFHLRRAVEASLRRLGTDRIDLFYLHRWDDVTALDETLRAVDDLVRQGKILYLAASNFTGWQAARAVGLARELGLPPLVALQPMYNLAKRQAEVELLPFAAAEPLAAFTYSPLGGGLLTGKYGVDTRPGGARLTASKMYAVRYADRSYYELAERFAALAGEVGVAPGTLAVAWVMSHPAVTAPIVSGRTLAQLEVSLAAASFTLTPELAARIAALAPAPPPATDRNEESSAFNFGTR